MTAVVLDASVLVELLVLSPRGERAAHLASASDLHLPHLADVETASVLRGLVRAKKLVASRAESALLDLRDLPARRWPADVLLERIWNLRENVTAYDATYIALAEALRAEFVTTDARLARAADRFADCTVVLIE